MLSLSIYFLFRKVWNLDRARSRDPSVTKTSILFWSKTLMILSFGSSLLETGLFQNMQYHSPTTPLNLWLVSKNMIRF